MEMFAKHLAGMNRSGLTEGEVDVVDFKVQNSVSRKLGY